MPDRFDDIAAILVRGPEPDEHDDRAEGLTAAELAALLERRRQQVAERLRVAARHRRPDADPVLATLAGLRRQRLEAESATRLLLAYAREFIEPRPYRLIDLADAAGMSISGVRTAYARDEVDLVAALIDQPPRLATTPAKETAP
jgi:AraC-like DNA-binding protein